MYLPYTIPHANNESWLVKTHGMEVPDLGIYADKDWSDEKKSGAAMITRLDNYVGQITRKLQELGIEKNTMVIFSSDNGPHGEGGWNPNFFGSTADFRGMKRDLYEGGIRVPFIIKWPETISPGEVDHVSAFWDFMPTACDVANVTSPQNIDGISFLPILLDKPQEQAHHEYLYWEFSVGAIEKQAVRKDSLICIRYRPKFKQEVIELYNVERDNKEVNNIAEKHPKLVKELTEIMNRYTEDN